MIASGLACFRAPTRGLSGGDKNINHGPLGYPSRVASMCSFSVGGIALDRAFGVRFTVLEMRENETWGPFYRYLIGSLNRQPAEC